MKLFSLKKTAIYFKSNFCLYIPDGYKKVPFRYLSLKTPHPRSSQTARARCYCQSLRTSRACLCPTRIVSTSVHVLFRSIVFVSFGFILGKAIYSETEIICYRLADEQTGISPEIRTE